MLIPNDPKSQWVKAQPNRHLSSAIIIVHLLVSLWQSQIWQIHYHNKNHFTCAEQGQDMHTVSCNQPTQPSLEL